MKKLIAIAGIAVLLSFSCRKELKNDHVLPAAISQTKFVCGTMEAMEGISAEMKEQIDA